MNNDWELEQDTAKMVKGLTIEDVHSRMVAIGDSVMQTGKQTSLT